MTDPRNPLGIDTGDTVFHRPSRETWLVAFVRDDRLAWCGWPKGDARVADCLLVEKATESKRAVLLRELADRRDSDMQQWYAQRYSRQWIEAEANRA